MIVLVIEMDPLAGTNIQTPGKRERTSLPLPREVYTNSYDDVVSDVHVATL